MSKIHEKFEKLIETRVLEIFNHGDGILTGVVNFQKKYEFDNNIRQYKKIKFDFAKNTIEVRHEGYGFTDILLVARISSNKTKLCYSTLQKFEGKKFLAKNLDGLEYAVIQKIKQQEDELIIFFKEQEENSRQD